MQTSAVKRGQFHTESQRHREHKDDLEMGWSPSYKSPSVSLCLCVRIQLRRLGLVASAELKFKDVRESNALGTKH